MFKSVQTGLSVHFTCFKSVWTGLSMHATCFKSVWIGLSVHATLEVSVDWVVCAFHLFKSKCMGLGSLHVTSPSQICFLCYLNMIHALLI